MLRTIGVLTSLAVLSLDVLPAATDGAEPRIRACPGDVHSIFSVSIAPELRAGSVSGRLLILMSSQLQPNEELAPRHGANAHTVWMAASEVRNLSSLTPVTLDADELAFPDAFCRAPAGTYRVRAILDVSHHYAYRSRPAEGDLLSALLERRLDPPAGEVVSLILTERKSDAPAPLPPRTVVFDFASPSLSAFWGRPIAMRGAIVLPPGYGSGTRNYPTVYLSNGFSQDLNYLLQRNAANLTQLMETKKIPEMIWVLLLQALPSGTHEFADSVNNGPWGRALTAELIPWLEKHYRMDGRPSGRLLTGHSSGGWAALWLQVSHPEFFGGTWPTAPDAADFRSFAGIDLTQRPLPNFYRLDDGSLRMFVRSDGQDTESLQDLARQERVLGDYGGQSASFEWVFSPRGEGGRPLPLFDRDTGEIDPVVAEYWEQHYDIAALLRRRWPKIGPLVTGRIHLTVGTADTFHLDEPARLLQQTLDALGGRAQFTYAPGRSHFDLYQDGLLERIAREMYAVARPREPVK